MLDSLIQSYKAGGSTMHLILVTGGTGVWIFWERLNALRNAGRVNKDELLNTVNSFILQGQIDKAISVCSQIKSPLTNIINAGLIAVKNGKDDEEVQTAMDAVALREVPKIEKRIQLLSTIANLATLAGLLGTIVGMIGAFAGVADAAPAEKAAILAAKISMSMNCTGFGLVFAVPLLGAYGWLNSWAQSLVDDIHEASVATLNFILSNRDKIR